MQNNCRVLVLFYQKSSFYYFIDLDLDQVISVNLNNEESQMEFEEETWLENNVSLLKLLKCFLSFLYLKLSSSDKKDFIKTAVKSHKIKIVHSFWMNGSSFLWLISVILNNKESQMNSMKKCIYKFTLYRTYIHAFYILQKGRFRKQCKLIRNNSYGAFSSCDLKICFFYYYYLNGE